SLAGVRSASGRLPIGPLPRLPQPGGGSRGSRGVARRLSTCPTSMAHAVSNTVILGVLLALVFAATLTAAPVTLKVRVKSATIEMPLEEYVAAVLAGECSTFRSDEGVKAMAVAARSYALNLRGRHAAQGYDLCATTHCQRVDPDAVTPRLAWLAAQTPGGPLWFERKPAFACYSRRSCGLMATHIVRGKARHSGTGARRRRRLRRRWLNRNCARRRGSRASPSCSALPRGARRCWCWWARVSRCVYRRVRSASPSAARWALTPCAATSGAWRERARN